MSKADAEIFDRAVKADPVALCFQIGDVVKLKSGGPWMTIDDVNNSGVIRCAWFTDSGDHKVEGFFKANMLVAKD